MAKRWYVAHVHSGLEHKIVKELNEQIEKKGMQDFFEQILVPTEEVIEVRKGEKVSSERKFFPGYILVKMEMTDVAWHLIKSNPKVTGFLGDKHKPIPITEKEAERLLKQIQEGIEKPKPAVTFDVGEQIRVSDGPFATFQGVVEEVDEDKARLKVTVTIFGRATPIELDYTQVEKL